MRKRLSWATSLDWLMGLVALCALIAVLQTFIIGKHYIIPSVLLIFSVLFGNLAWYALQGARWAKLVNFWCGVLLTSHGFFALFWSVKYRAVLGDYFEGVGIVVTLLVFFTTFLYAKYNRLHVTS
ncbi:MAG: hypothetical protein GW763_12185 [Paraglaciecola sp.]|nr:hypothetical protein [Paraglaciecola sp.]NCT48722.1 hypothetical protein [Paraglaciecola sp.]